MNIETWTLMTGKDRENWHRKEIEKLCQELKSKKLVKRKMLSRSFGVDLNPIYATTMAFLTLPD
jgi:hypothetical protein